MRLVAAVFLLGASAAGPLEYPFGPFTDAKEVRAAAKFRRGLEQKGGIGRAIRRVCTADANSMEVADLVARNFLIERADRSYPLLLDALRRADEAPESTTPWQCRAEIEAAARFAVCCGWNNVSLGPELDAHPLAVERRSLAQRALAKAIAGGGRRAKLAMEVLLTAGKTNCTGLKETVHVATPVLVQLLGVPKRPFRIPGGDLNGPHGDWESAFRALSFGGADRAVAERPVAAFLAHDATAPLAALTLARMGADITAEIPRLARILDGISLGEGDDKRFWEQLKLLDDTADALMAIGKAARGALPNVAALVARTEAPGCRHLGAARHVDLVRSIATAEDADQAVACLAPLLACPGSHSGILQALGAFGVPARTPLLSVLRDENRTIGERLESVPMLAQTGQTDLGDPDRRLVALLQAKKKSHAELRVLYYGKWAAGTAAELGRCQAEAGLGTEPAPAGGVSQDFTDCLSGYLCGPAFETYLHTMERCCARMDSRRLPSYCVGFRGARANTAPDAAPLGSPSNPR